MSGVFLLPCYQGSETDAQWITCSTSKSMIPMVSIKALSASTLRAECLWLLLLEYYNIAPSAPPHLRP